MYYLSDYHSPVGRLTLVGTGACIVGLRLAGQGGSHAETPPGFLVDDDQAVFVKGKKWLDRYFEGRRPSPDALTLAPDGNEFRQAVWRFLLEIPYGETTTYGALALKTAQFFDKRAMSAQAVGGAIGHNPIPIIIPCHRVIGAGGNLTGYSGPIDIKIRLLKHEGVDMRSIVSRLCIAD
ncbi:MAG: methylated-DNA--[protein]-cysteine S-methyltransferase [Victivallaceae bacterium]|nr:methylated-DNA--[protein]-cysteine S-methyltransferase [Victivallaceae bacterium]